MDPINFAIIFVSMGFIVAEESMFKHKLPDDTPMLAGRHPFIVSRCTGKDILHIGCVDTGLLNERYDKNQLLHQKLLNVSKSVIGIDIDEAGIEFLKEKGVKDLFVMDLEKEEGYQQINDKIFDVIVLSEVLEHLSNPGAALELLKSLTLSQNGFFIISVPNAFSLRVLLDLFWDNSETVHADHNVYYSAVTLKSFLEKHDYAVTEEYVYAFIDADALPNSVRADWGMRPASSLRREFMRFRQTPFTWLRKPEELFQRIVARAALRRSRYWGDGILVVARPNTM
jgi:2-polyprenyl-3-methyl-5-hydroxy-6-metoxy-1,4-benzoquinol methylase